MVGSRAPPQPPPPTFDSFPDLGNEGSSSISRSASAKSRVVASSSSATPADSFLDSLSTEIRRGDSKKSQDKRRHEDENEDDEQDRRRHRPHHHHHHERREHRSSRRQSASSTRTQHDEDDRHASGKEDKGRGKGKEREREKDKVKVKDELSEFKLEREYGEKRRKPYQLVQASSRDPNADSIAPHNDPEPTPTEDKKRSYYSSRRGDEFNVTYGGLHRGDVPRYRRMGAGRVLGLNEGLRITKETAYTGRGIEVGPIRRFRTPRYSDSRVARYMVDKNFRRVSLVPQSRSAALGEPASIDENDPFADRSDIISFEKERSFSETMDGLEHEQGTDYRSITGLIKPSDLTAAGEDEGSSNEFDQLGIKGGESHAQYLSRRNIELDKALRDDPENVELWIEFAEWQDQVALASLGGGASSTKRRLNKVERASTAEVKLSIFERAFKASEKNEKDERMLLAWLEAAGEVESAEKVLAKWKRTVEKNPTVTSLWIEYVGWKQTNGGTFRIDLVVEVYVECLEVLRTTGEKAGSADEKEMIDANMVYLFLRLCLMLRQAGFTERALASFQAIIELNLFRPPSLHSPHSDESESAWRSRVLEAIETFWDDEAPRIGDAGAIGWCNTPDGVEPPVAEPDMFPSPPSDAELRDHERWAWSERLASEANPRPARMNDPGVDENDYRVPLFEPDIKPFLFIVHSADAKQQLVYAFLTFLGLPFVPPDFPTSTPFATDGFIHSRIVEDQGALARFWPHKETRKVLEVVGGEAMEPERKPALDKPWNIPFRATPCVVDLLFGTRQGWFTTIKKEDLEGMDTDLSRNALSLLLTVSPDVFVPLDFFAFESCQSPKLAVKLAKSVLRTKRQALALWDGYARIERARGKIDDARQVYVTALSIYQTFSIEEQIDGPLLWRAWAEMEWEEGRSDLALKVLLAAAGEGTDLTSLVKNEDSRSSPAQNLRARQFYTTELESSFQPHATQRLVRNRNHLAFSFALFEYFSRSDLASSVTDIFEQHLFRLEVAGAKGSSEHEEAYQAYVKLLYRHAEKGKGGFRPGQMRDVLERAIAEFKNNTMFLSLYYHNELRTKIQNRVRRTMEDLVLKKEPTSQGYLFAIFAEAHLDARSTNVWGVRNLFDRAIEDPRTRSAPSIWALYIHFELLNGDLKRVKALLYRSVGACPWCRDLYLLAFRPELRTVFTSHELRNQWHETMFRRGLRLRLELDSFIKTPALRTDEEDRSAESANEDDAMLEGAEIYRPEAEELLSEREALKPY